MESIRSVRGFARFNMFVGYIGGVAILLMMLASVTDVLSRSLFNVPLPGAMDAVQHLMVITIVCGLAYCGYAGGHITINMLDPLLDRPSLRYLNVLVHLTGFVLLSLIAWRCGIAALDAFATDTNSNTLRIRAWPFYVAISLGMLAYALVLASHAIAAWNGKFLPSTHELSE